MDNSVLVMESELQPYPANKPSGVGWLGDVPAYLEVRRLRNVVYPDND